MHIQTCFTHYWFKTALQNNRKHIPEPVRVLHHETHSRTVICYKICTQPHSLKAICVPWAPVTMFPRLQRSSWISHQQHHTNTQTTNTGIQLFKWEGGGNWQLSCYMCWLLRQCYEFSAHGVKEQQSLSPTSSHPKKNFSLTYILNHILCWQWHLFSK
jgi:hypothetical protein